MSGLFDEKGHPLKVQDGAAATSAVLGGKAYPKKDGLVAVVNPDGKVVDISGADLHSALAGGGYSVATEQQARQAALETKLGAPGTVMGMANQIAAKNLALGRGATGPGTDALVTEVAGLFGKKENAKEYLRDLKEAYPITSGANEVAGMVATVLAGGAGGGAKAGAAALPRAAGLARGAAAVGEGLEGARLLSGGIGAGRLGAGGLEAGEALGGAARGLGELPASRLLGPAPGVAAAASDIGAGAGAAEGVASAARPTVGLRGDFIARAAMPSSAIDLLGGGAEKAVRAGLGDGLGGRIAGYAARGAVENSLIEAGKKIDESVLGEDPDLNAQKLLAATGHGAILGAALGAGFGGVTEGLAGIGRGLAPVISRKVEDILIDALGATGKQRQKIDKLGRSEFVKTALEFTEPGGKTSDMAPKVKAGLDELREMLIKEHGAGGKGPRMRDVYDAIKAASSGKGETEYAALRDLFTLNEYNAGPRAKVGKLLQDMAADNPSSMSEWWGWLQRISSEAKYEAKSAPASANALRDVRSIVQDAMFEAGDRNAAKLGAPEWSARVKDLNKRFQHLKLLEQLTEKQASAQPKFSFMEKLLIPMAFWSTGPLGLVKGMAASLVLNQGRQRAAGIANVLDKTAGIGSLRKAITDVDTAMDSSIAGFFGNVKARPKFRIYDGPDKESASPRERFDRRVEMLDRVQASPMSLQNGIRRAYGGMELAAPNTSAALTSATARAVQYMRANAPVAGMTPLGQRNQVSDADIRSFNRKWEAVDNPIDTLIGGLSSGRITPDQVEAVNAVHPALIEDVKGRVVTHVAEQKAKGKTVPKQKLIQLSILFDTKLDPAIDLTPMMQSHLKQAPTKPSKPGGGGGLPDFSSMYRTDTERRHEARQ